MKNEHKIYAFFSFLCMLASNFFILKLLFVNSGDTFYSTASQVGIWSNTFFWAIVTYLFYKNRIKRKIANIIFSASFIVVIFMLTVTADRSLGLLLNIENKPEGLIFEPNTVSRYKTTEFDIEARINSLGLRDKEIDIKRNDKTRILCFGDSWTFGWGVDIEQSWPKELEKYLIDKGYNVEVINCGQPGQYTTAYRTFMKRTIPLLKPDIVIVGVLQLHDLFRLYAWHHKIPVNLKERSKSRINEVIKKFINKSYVNTAALLKHHFSPPVVDISDKWKTQAEDIIGSFNTLQALKYETTDDTVREMYESGNLHIVELNIYMEFPELYVIFNDPDNRATRFAVDKMIDNFNKKKKLCEENDCLLIFCNLPMSEFTGHILKRTSLAESIHRDYLYNNNKIDSIYKDVADKTDVPYFELTDIFKNLEPKDSYFFSYDGHPNEKGHDVMGRSIGEYLIENKFLTAEKRKMDGEV